MIDLKKSGIVISLLSVAACGGSSSPSGTAMTTLTLSSGGVSPRAASVEAGSSVNIVNNDSVAHQLVSIPDGQVACPELNTPVLASGDQFTATISNRAGTCAFEDRLHPTDSNFQGTITVTSFPAPTPDG